MARLTLPNSDTAAPPTGAQPPSATGCRIWPELAPAIRRQLAQELALLVRLMRVSVSEPPETVDDVRDPGR
jgi:hypothetical protein